MLGNKKKMKKNNHIDSKHDGNKNDGDSTSENAGQHRNESPKRTKFIPREVKYLIIVIAVVAIFWLGLKVVLQVDNPFYIVSSESMVPTLMVGDIVVVRNGHSGISGGGGFSFSDLQVGDIIVFHTEDESGRTIVHRVVEIYHENDDDDNNNNSTEGRGERLIKTKGDANPVSYEGLDYPIGESDYYGKVIFVIPKVGLIFNALMTSSVRYILILVVAVSIASISIIMLRSRRNKLV